VRFLDNVVDANAYVLPEIEAITRGNRKIGLGIMGFSDMLIKRGIKYDTEEGLKAAEELMKFIDDEGHKTSMELGKEKGNFPNFHESTLEKTGRLFATPQ
jgi:ribonucleoside-diphosphate reductase alpha chain